MDGAIRTLQILVRDFYLPLKHVMSTYPGMSKGIKSVPDKYGFLDQRIAFA